MDSQINSPQIAMIKFPPIMTNYNPSLRESSLQTPEKIPKCSSVNTSMLRGKA